MFFDYTVSFIWSYQRSVNFVRGVVIPRYLSYINSLKIYDSCKSLA